MRKRNLFGLLFCISIMTLAACGGGNGGQTVEPGKPGGGNGGNTDDGSITVGHKDYAALVQKAISASNRNAMLKYVDGAFFIETSTSFKAHLTYDFPNGSGSLARTWDITIKKSGAIVSFEGHVNNWDNLDIDIPLKGNKYIFIYDTNFSYTSMHNMYHMEKGYEYNERRNGYTNLNPSYLEQFEVSVDEYKEMLCIPGFYSNIVENDVYRFTFKEINNHQYNVALEYNTDFEGRPEETEIRFKNAVLDTSLDVFLSYENEFSSGAVMRFELTEYGNTDLIKEPSKLLGPELTLAQKIENTKTLIDSNNLTSNYSAQFTRAGSGNGFPNDKLKIDLTYKKNGSKLYKTVKSTGNYGETVRTDYDLYCDLYENKQVLTYKYLDGYITSEETNSTYFTTFPTPKLPTESGNLKISDFQATDKYGTYTYETQSNNRSYTYTLEVDEEYVTKFEVNATNQNGTMYEYTYFALSDVDSTVVPEFNDSAITAKELTTRACSNMNKPHRVTLDPTYYHQYEDWVIEYDKETENVLKLHIMPKTGDDYYLEVNTSTGKNYYYSKNGETYEKTEVSQSESDNFAKPYYLIIKDHADLLNSNDTQSSKVNYRVNGSSERDGFLGSFYFIDKEGAMYSVYINGTIENPNLSKASYTLMLDGQREWYDLESAPISGVTLPQ